MNHEARLALAAPVQPCAVLRRWAAVLLLPLWLPFLAACAQLAPQARPSGATAACSTWFSQLEAAVDAAGVRDVEAERIPGFAGLRVDRLAFAAGALAQQDDARFGAWLTRLQALEHEGRAVELRNLPPLALQGLPVAQDRDLPLPHTRLGSSADAGGAADPAAAALQRSLACSQAWTQTLALQPALRQQLLQQARVPDRYSGALRAAGLYPLVRWPFFAGVKVWQQEHVDEVLRWAQRLPSTQRYTPRPMVQPRLAVTDEAARDTARGAAADTVGTAAAGDAQTTVAALWRQHRPDVLGLPQFTPQQLRTLLDLHAPVLEVENAGSADAAAAFDRFGAVGWAPDGQPQVDTTRPTMYERVSATRYGSQGLLQLVYTVWFPQRPARSRFDLLAGALDAVVLRLTLAADDGRVLMLDSMHGCGCYQMFMPAADVTVRPGGPTTEEWAFVPLTLPLMRPGQRLVVRLSSATHQVVGAAPDGGASGVAVDLLGERLLRTLPLMQDPAGVDPPRASAAGAADPSHGSNQSPAAATPPHTARRLTRSLYGPDGLVAASQRGERLLFWPMGIRSAGAMRQWGHHATAFVGRRHFDDPDLLLQRFVLPEPRSAAATALPPPE